MSDRRFWFVIDKGKLEYVQDLVTGEKITVTDLEDLLNEQQATINELKKNFDDIVKWASEISKRNVVLDEQIGQLQRENEQLRQEREYWKSKAMTLLMQVRRLTPRMTDKEVKEFSKELDDE